MNFYSVRDLRTTQKAIWEKLEQDGEVVITNNGKPSALLFDIGDGDLEETLKAVRQAKAMMAFNSMRGKAAAKGYLSEEEIDKAYAGSDRYKHLGLGTVVQERFSCKSVELGAQRKGYPLYR